MTFNWDNLYLAMAEGDISFVLNLVIYGWPSIPKNIRRDLDPKKCFKPCYIWMTFNTNVKVEEILDGDVLNLVIYGWPSILK